MPSIVGASTRFAVIGDFGDGGENEAAVAALVESWRVDFIITLGDNNYRDGQASTIDKNIGQYFSNYIYPYKGKYGSSAKENRFFPSLGNHDWKGLACSKGNCLGAYLDYFELPTFPGQERYYNFIIGPIHFFVIDSDSHEPDGVTATSAQARWLQFELENSTARWKIVYFHHPAYCSCILRASNKAMQWPFSQWGADVVMSGHSHTYERIFRDGIVYFVNGLGGRSRYDFATPIEGSQARYNEKYGAMRATADAKSIHFEFIDVEGSIIDQYTLPALLPIDSRTGHVESGPTSSVDIGYGQNNRRELLIAKNDLRNQKTA